MTIEILGWTLLHFLWQGALAAGVFAGLHLSLKRASPQLRYLAACATLLAMVCLPVATFMALRASQETTDDARSIAFPAIAPSAPAAGEMLAPGRSVLTLGARIEPAMPALVALWAAGVLLLSLRSLGGWTLAQRVRRVGLCAVPPEIEAALTRLAAQLRVSRPVRLFESALVEVPTCIGWLRPLVLLPASTLAGLSMQQLELLLAHELAHVRRRDYLVNLVQTAAETLLFYHPAVWWVSHRMRVEREHCCDDLAVAACGDAIGYARALAALEERRSPTPALAMAADGASLLARIRRLAGLSHEPRSTRAPALAVTAVLTAIAGVGSLLLAGAVVSSPWSVFALDGSVPVSTRTPQTPEPAAAAEEDESDDAVEPRADERSFSLSLIIEMARQGVTAEYVDEMAELGYPSLTPEQLIELRSQGVDPEDVRQLAEAGYRGLSPAQLVELRNQGVDADFALGLKEQGLEGLSLADLVQLRSQGVDPEYIAELKQAGQEGLTVSRLISLRNQGVDGEFIAELKAQGYDGLSTNRLIGLRSMGVTPEYVRELAELGYRGIDVPMLIGLVNAGVTSDYVRELKEAGAEGLKVEELIELRSQGVEPELVRRFKGRR